MTLDDSVHGMRLRAMQRAQAIGNVSAVCRELGISRTLFYRWRTRFEPRSGAEPSPHDRPRRQHDEARTQSRSPDDEDGWRSERV